MEFTKEYISTLIDKYGNTLLRLAYTYLKNKADAEDILQDVFLKLIDKKPIFNDENHEKAWLIRVTINLCKNKINLFWNKNKCSVGEIGEVYTYDNYNVNSSVLDTDNENIECGSNFIEEFNTISEIREKVGYDFEYPKFMPNGYKMDNINLMFNSFIQISYVNGDMTIDYRTQNENGDISGNYKIYEDVEDININGREICIKGNDNKFYTAVYTGENSFSIYATQGLDKKTLIEIIKSIN